MQTNFCGHFSTEVELLSVQHTGVILRVPVRRCALAEHMIGILSRTEEGQDVAAKIQLLGSSSEPRIRAAFGPDLEVINRAECTTTRCQVSCTPGYRQVLLHFGYAGEAEQETGSGCLEVSADVADRVT